MDTGKRTVLVVDDDEAHRYSLSRRLDQAGFKVVEAENGEEGLRLAQGVDAIILDVRLPDITGFEVCRRLRESDALRGVPIVHISGAYVQTPDMVQGLSSGADAYLTRPIDDEVVAANLMALLRLRENLQRVSDELDEKRRKEQEATDLFMAVLGHDLRNPLDAISMSGHLLERAAASPEVISQTARRIRSAVGRMTHLLDDIQDYARNRLGTDLALRRTPQELAALAEAAVEELRATHPDIRADLQAQSRGAGEWDGPRLSRVISNLLRNAFEHGQAGSAIRIRVSDTEGEATLAVHNEGPPIPAETMRQLFQPMVKRTTAAPTGSNMGLGLFVCREIVTAHGGSISVKSDGDGTEFTVRLPVGR